MVFLSSVAGQMGSQTDPPYSASKAANINFAQCMAKDLAASGVRVNSVCPGMVKTPLNESVWKSWYDQQPGDQRLSYDAWAAAKINQVIPLRRAFAAFLFALAVYPAAAGAQEFVSTRCHESEVALDATHNAARLEDCGDATAPNLLWHLDRIDQLDGTLDGRYRRRALGGGSVVYVMDTGHTSKSPALIAAEFA